MQDNKSAILLQKNWPYSTRKGRKHIHVWYFFVVDKIRNKEVKIIYCPTELMIADFNTKPLQGALFYFFKNKIMGVLKTRGIWKIQRQLRWNLEAIRSILRWGWSIWHLDHRSVLEYDQMDPWSFTWALRDVTQYFGSILASGCFMIVWMWNNHSCYCMLLLLLFWLVYL